MSFQLKEQTNKGLAKTKKNKRSLIQDIENEYSIKRCNFNPISPSPNKFIKNLEVRMRMYYKELYRSYK
jgi:hypothetical protein